MKPNIALLHLVAILLATIPPAQAQQGGEDSSGSLGYCRAAFSDRRSNGYIPAGNS